MSNPASLLLHRGVIDGFGMQLLFDVVVQAHLLHGFHVAGTRAERDAIQDVDDFVAVRWRRLLSPYRPVG